jgi:hypothetical protein
MDAWLQGILGPRVPSDLQQSACMPGLLLLFLDPGLVGPDANPSALFPWILPIPFPPLLTKVGQTAFLPRLGVILGRDQHKKSPTEAFLT